jgi:hypothetical protein
VALAYGLSFLFMCLLGVLSDFTNSIAWGFNFLWASLAAMLIKFVVKQLRKHNLMHREYINNYQMDRISGFSFDLMIVAGVAAIEINDIKNYILPIVILSLVGTVVTYLYIRKVAKDVTKDLKKAGDFGGTGAFRKSIGVEIQETRIGIDAVIGAKKPYYRLTHLLEFGHAKQNGGRTKAFNFVAPINDTVFDRYRKELEDLLNDI